MKSPRNIRYLIRRTYVIISNVLVFLSVVIERRWPVHKWPMAWRHCQAMHQAEVRRMLTELTMSGRIKRRIKGNEFVYYPTEKGDEHR
jgi:hypothetical protein